MSRARRPPTSLMQYHGNGEVATPKPVPRFHAHSSEPGSAALLHQRNPHHTEEFPLKVFPRHAASPQHRFRPGMYADGDCGPQGESTLNQTISTLEAMKLAQHRAYAGMNASKVSSCGVAASISHEKYLQQKASQRANDCSPSGDSVNNSWLYITKSEAAFRRKKSLSRIDPFAPSSDGPDWFKINEKSSVKMSDLTKAPGFDGTLTLLSRINGWITVTPKEKNRSKRLGRYGPFDRSKKEMDLKNVSDLAPHWMHTDAAKPTNAPQFRKLPGITALRSGHKQTYLIDTQKPPRSQFAIGDFRHNVMTKAEADRYMAVAAPVPKNMFEWKEDVVKQRFDKPVTGKVGQSLQL